MSFRKRNILLDTELNTMSCNIAASVNFTLFFNFVFLSFFALNFNLRFLVTLHFW